MQMRKEYNFATTEKKKDLGMDKVNTNFFNIHPVMEEYGTSVSKKSQVNSSNEHIQILGATNQTEFKINNKTWKDIEKSGP